MTERVSIENNYRRITERIEAACSRSGRSSDSVTLVAVSKTFPERLIRVLYDIGHRDFGENKVQELLQKATSLHEQGLSDIRWHMIGHLQRNKVRNIVGVASLIHAVDSLRLAQELDRRGAGAARPIPCLVQVNISGEETKHGLHPRDVETFLRECEAFPHVDPVGLMAMPAPVASADQARPDFVNLRGLLEAFNSTSSSGNRLRYLSMGMSDDFEVAVEEGATHIRIGSAIFGTRA